ncbi:unnamed protein product [Rangifer tarandus platyrhynchus]|uniref:Uncharacterized protein n=1 Tax=Rangifer tarandus platyrhynchus TaxID=3082113 RepID=A0AC59ZSC2_RANTA
MGETRVQSLGWEDPLEKRMATHSSILTWRIPWTVQSMGLQRVRQDFHFTKNFGLPRWHSGKKLACQCRRSYETQVQSLGWEDPLEKGTATHSSILAWKIPWTE